MSSFDSSERDRSAAAPNLTPGRRPLSRRGFLLRGIGAAGLSAVSTAVYAAAIEPERLVTTSYRLTPPGWNAGRLSVAAIADLHAGGPNMAAEHISRVVDATNALRPDLVVLLGDYVAHHRFVTERVPAAVWAGEFASLSAPLGVCAILGNHDWWFDVRPVRRAFEQVGIPSKTAPSCWARAGPVSGSPDLETSWRTCSGAANSAARTICPARCAR